MHLVASPAALHLRVGGRTHVSMLCVYSLWLDGTRVFSKPQAHRIASVGMNFDLSVSCHPPALASRAMSNGVNVKTARLPDDLMGLWDPQSRTIWLDDRLTAAERRCTLEHELVHAERGDGPCATAWHQAKQEASVDREAARRLIDLEDLVSGILRSQDERELAEHLHVDVDTVLTRLSDLTPRELRHVEQRLAEVEASWGFRWHLRRPRLAVPRLTPRRRPLSDPLPTVVPC